MVLYDFEEYFWGQNVGNTNIKLYFKDNPAFRGMSWLICQQRLQKGSYYAYGFENIERNSNVVN